MLLEYVTPAHAAVSQCGQPLFLNAFISSIGHGSAQSFGCTIRRRVACRYSDEVGSSRPTHRLHYQHRRKAHYIRPAGGRRQEAGGRRQEEAGGGRRRQEEAGGRSVKQAPVEALLLRSATTAVQQGRSTGVADRALVAARGTVMPRRW